MSSDFIDWISPEIVKSRIIRSPLHVMVGKKKYPINLNFYRNCHYHVTAKAKIAYKEAIKVQVQSLPIYKKIELTYKFYPGTARLTDTDNIIAITAKFVQDALVELGRIESDNYNFISCGGYDFVSIDRDHPRVDIIIKELIK